MTQMQGIVSILGSDSEKMTKVAPLRRTLSADMSSKKWLADSGLPMMKKIASSEQIAIDSSESDEEECVVTKGDQNPSRTDIWSAIMSKKQGDKLPPPYVHPLVKKSASSLSEKSLKVCTESLGSETGSDVFSSQASSQKSDDKEEKVEEDIRSSQTSPKSERSETGSVVKSACLTTKKAQQARSFPPPLPSLAAARTDGPSLHVHSHRVDGRLVLEAVEVQQQKYFESQRQDGRFLLTLINDPKEEPTDHDNDINEKDKDEKKTDFNNIDVDILNDPPLKYSPTLVVNIHKPPVTIKRIFERGNENISWSRTFNKKDGKMAKLEVVEEEEVAVTTKSRPTRSRSPGLPPLPPATLVNSYQYFWRVQPSVASVIDPLITQHPPPTKTKDLVVLRGNNADCFLPSLKCYKEPRRSLVMWEPFCIATS